MARSKDFVFLARQGAPLNSRSVSQRLVKITHMDPKLEQRIRFAELRHQYYAAGRVLFLSNCMRMGALMLAYAIEGSLKHALNEQNFGDKGILHSHDICLLFQTCRQLGMFAHVEASPDLLEYADDLFNQRYPSQIANRSEEMVQRNRAMSMTSSILIAYDDLLVQLDTSLWTLTDDHLSSAAIIAARTSNSYDGRIFFHCNAPAVSMLDRYLETVRKYYPTEKADIDQLEKAVDHLYYFPETHIRFAPFEQVKAAQPAKRFRYPGRVVRNSEGKITELYGTSDFLA